MQNRDFIKWICISISVMWYPMHDVYKTKKQFVYQELVTGKCKVKSRSFI